MVESSPIKVDVYEMPQFRIKSFQKLDKPLYAPYGAFFGVMGDIGVVKDFGVTLHHQWDFGDGMVVEGGDPGRVSHIYSEGGTYTVKLSVFDDRGESSVDSLEITILDPPPLVVGPFKLVASNKYNRAPLSLYVKPVVSGGNPALDKVSSYRWSINGEGVSDGRMLKVTLNDPGDYLIGLRVETKTGKVAEGEELIRVNPNQVPVCEISYQDYPKYKYTKIFSSCYDPDGKVKSYFWDLGDGTTSERTKVFAKYEQSGTYEVTLTVTDDSGAQATFSMPVTVER
jgi:PKD repeat protein